MFSDRFLAAILSFTPAQKNTHERQEPTSSNCIYLFYFFFLGFYGSFEGIFAYPFENSRNVIYPGKIQSVSLSISGYSGSRTKDIKMKQFNLTNWTDQDERAGSRQYQKGALACSYFLNALLLIEIPCVI